jgi:hypothetical protein
LQGGISANWEADLYGPYRVLTTTYAWNGANFVLRETDYPQMFVPFNKVYVRIESCDTLWKSLMAEIVLGEPLASQIRDVAEAEGVPVESLIGAALRHYTFQAQRTKLDAEARWWWAASPEQRSAYAGQYVAVHRQEVVDHDRDEAALRGRVRARFGKVAVLISPAEGRREWRMVSTRLARL